MSEKMDCALIRKLLPDYTEGSLDPEKQAVVSDHIQICSECKQFTEYIHKAYILIESEKNPASDPYMFERIRSIIEIKQPKKTTFYLKPVLIAAMFLLVVFSGITLGSAYARHRSIASDYAREIFYLGAQGNSTLQEITTQE